MEGLDLLGATSTSLSHQFITLRIKNIDMDVLQKKLGGSTGALASAALPLINTEPKALLDLASPFIGKAAKSYGLDVETTVSNVPPVGGARAISEFWPGLFSGILIGGLSIGLVKVVGGLIRR